MSQESFDSKHGCRLSERDLKASEITEKAQKEVFHKGRILLKTDTLYQRGNVIYMLDLQLCTERLFPAGDYFIAPWLFLQDDNITEYRTIQNHE